MARIGFVHIYKLVFLYECMVLESMAYVSMLVGDICRYSTMCPSWCVACVGEYIYTNWFDCKCKLVYVCVYMYKLVNTYLMCPS